MQRPLAIELYAGTFGHTRGWLDRGGWAVGFDIEHLPHHGVVPNGADLVLQDVLTINGAQFKDAAVIFASPPCQHYSWLAMPWSRSKSEHSQAAKALRHKWETEGPDNRLFEACFRIQREAIDAAGHYIPLIVENVRGAQEWVGAVFYGLDAWLKASREERWRMGRSAWNHGSFHLWGDVPALMPVNMRGGRKGTKPLEHRGWTAGTAITLGLENYNGTKTQGGSWFRERNGVPQPGIRHEDRGVKVASEDGGRRTDPGKGARFTTQDCGVEARPEGTNADGSVSDGTKIGGHEITWRIRAFMNSTCGKHGSRSSARKAASALIARIPPVLSDHFADVFFPH